jgi:hypothetical protein
LVSSATDAAVGALMNRYSDYDKMRAMDSRISPKLPGFLDAIAIVR